MKFIVIAVGSRGDAEPFCALAKALVLKHKEASVDLFLQKDMVAFAPMMLQQQQHNNRLRTHALPFTKEDFYKYVGPQSKNQGAGHSNPRVQFVGIIAETIGELVLPCFDQVVSAAAATLDEECVIVASSLARQLALAVAAGENCRVALVQLQPMQPVVEFPHYSHGEECVRAITNLQGDDAIPEVTPEEALANLETYWEPEKFQHEFVLERLSKLCVLDFEKDMRPILLGDRANVVIVNAFSNQLVPRVGNAWHVGPLAADYVASPPPDDDHPLMKFLQDNNKPICVGYGSMPFGQVSTILSALESLDRKAIVVGQCFVDAIKENDPCSAWVQENVCAVESAPYPWLLPYCSMMLSHGGAGVVNAALRAGIPQVISPLMGDQFFWSQLLTRKNLGVATASSLTALTKQDVMEGICQADSMCDTARQVGEAIRNEERMSGADDLAERLGRWE